MRIRCKSPAMTKRPHTQEDLGAHHIDIDDRLAPSGLKKAIDDRLVPLIALHETDLGWQHALKYLRSARPTANDKTPEKSLFGDKIEADISQPVEQAETTKPPTGETFVLKKISESLQKSGVRQTVEENNDRADKEKRKLEFRCQQMLPSLISVLAANIKDEKDRQDTVNSVARFSRKLILANRGAGAQSVILERATVHTFLWLSDSLRHLIDDLYLTTDPNGYANRSEFEAIIYTRLMHKIIPDFDYNKKSFFRHFEEWTDWPGLSNLVKESRRRAQVELGFPSSNRKSSRTALDNPRCLGDQKKS